MFDSLYPCHRDSGCFLPLQQSNMERSIHLIYLGCQRMEWGRLLYRSFRQEVCQYPFTFQVTHGDLDLNVNWKP